jgi:uncharacterized protein YkwD
MQNIIILILSSLIWFSSPEIQTEEENWPTELNTAKGASYLNELEREVIFELNKVRSDPKRYSKEYLEDLYSAYKGKVFAYPGQESTVTKEGNGALMECIQVLRNTEPVPILNPAEGLAKASKLLVNDQQFGGIGHITRKGLTPQDRMEKYGEWNICSGEDIAYGNFEARQIVISLLIDDGVPDRGHRNNILNPKSRYVGVSFGKHPSYRAMCVIDYAGDFKAK